MKKATKISDIYRVFKPEPLPISDLANFYIDCYDVRGNEKFRAKMLRRLTDSGEFRHILFVGYKGCGKSTELNYLQKDLEERNFLVINFSVRTELNPLDFSYIEFIIATMGQLFEHAQKNSIRINKTFFKNIETWLRDKEVSEVFEKYNISGELNGGAEAKVNLPFLAKIFAKFKIVAKSSKSLKETLTQTIEPKLADLIEYCNDLITEINLSLQRDNKTSLVFIIEDMDKIPRKVSGALFFDYGATLRQLKANFIFTFPIALYHDARFQTIDANFDDHSILPMIKVKNKDGSIYQQGVKAITKIVEKRMDLSLFKDSTQLPELISLSGGVLRDLFRLIGEAAEFALDANNNQISEQNITDSINKLKADYKNNIADNPENHLTVNDYYDALIQLATNPNKDVDNTQAVLDLRQNLSILAYNGEGWYDLHPLIRIILKERGRIE